MNRSQAVFKAALFLFTLVLIGSFIMAQTSGLVGTVKDVTGAVIPGVDVNLLNQGNNQERNVVTNDMGEFQFFQINPGFYTLKVELTGFKTNVINDMRLLVDNTLSQEVVLETGQINEVVTVTGSAQVLNRTDATIGNTFNTIQIQELPMESRNVVGLLTLQPGVTEDGEVSGTRSDQSNMTLDGIDVNDQQTGEAFGSVLRVTPDSVQEFRVTTASANASQGRSSGAQISLVTRSGTNEFHGALYEYHRNTVTTANDFFNNRSGVPTPALIRNLFGGRLGGPVIKDKVYFFYNYEGRTDRKGQSVIRNVPLPHLGQGELVYENTDGEWVHLTNAEVNAYYPDVGTNPLALTELASAASRYPANDNSGGDSVNTGGYRFNASLPLNYHTHTAKIDFNLAENHQFNVRGNYQWDSYAYYADVTDEDGPRFPDSPGIDMWSHPIGVAANYTWTASPTLVNSFRYGFTRLAYTRGGDSTDPDISFRFVFQPRQFLRTLSRVTPVHNFVDDVSWIKDNHTFQFGANLRFIDNERSSLNGSFDSAVTNPSFYELSGASVSNQIPDVSAGTTSTVQNAATAILGRYSQYSGNYIYGVDGNLLTPGTFIDRDFATEEFELYAQDTWKITQNLTMTYGLRWSTSKPVYEKNGYQVKPNIPLGEYLASRASYAEKGMPYNELIQVNLSGPYWDKGGWYEQDWNNLSPRIAMAYSPHFESGFLNTIFGDPGKSVLRAGFSRIFDRIGNAMAVNFDLSNPMGFSSSQTIAANTYNVTDNPAPLFTGFNQDVRSLPKLSPPDSITFPLTVPADEDQRIETSLDDTLITPSNYSWNVSWGREFPAGIYFEASYVGRSGRNLMAQQDVVGLPNLVDPESGMDWYGAALDLAKQRDANVPWEEVRTIPYFENLFPYFTWLGDPGMTVTQNVALFTFRDGEDIKDWTYLQLYMDDDGIYPNMFYQPQFAALNTWSTVSWSDYHAGQFTFRERFSDALSLDINYTFAKSMDNASGAQDEGNFDGASFILNPYRPGDAYSRSNFDMHHMVNANWMWAMPFGKGKSYLADISGFADAILGGWQLHGIFRFNTGMPQRNPFDSAQWATNWNVQSNGVRIRNPGANPQKSGVAPNFWSDNQYAFNSYRNAYPGETGDRNVLNMSEYMTLDFGLSKVFKMPVEGHRVQFRWEVFNAFNQQFLGPIDPSDRPPNGLTQDPQLGTAPPNFGNIVSIQGSPRVMQFALRYDF
jgi:hypothetical protein